MARPKKKIDKIQFEAMCGIQCTKEEICTVLGVTEKTLDRWCKEVYGMRFSLVFTEKRNIGKTSLRRNQWKLAESGNPTMLVWLGKNLLGQKDNSLQDEIKLRELKLKEREFEIKEKLMLRQLQEGNNESDIARTLREIFGREEDEQ